MFTIRNSQAAQQSSYNTANSGGNSVITIAANSLHRWVIDQIVFGYESAITAGSLVITDITNSTTKLKVPITATGLQSITFEDGFEMPEGSAIEIKLVDGSATKHLTVIYR